MDVDWWLSTYGLTPDAVDELPAVWRERLPQIRAVKAEVAAERQQRKW